MKPEWVVKEEVEIKQMQAEGASRTKEEQEWYQKWLRRQENKPKNWAADWKDDGGPIDPEEKRRNPDDKEHYSFAEIKQKYASRFKPEEVEAFWRKEMKPLWVVEEEGRFKEALDWERAKPKEEQEWYQKWLRRQENKIVNWAADWKDDGGPIDMEEERQDPTDKEWYTFDKLKVKYAKAYKPEELETFWRRECKPGWVVEQEDNYKSWEEQERSKPKEEQE